MRARNIKPSFFTNEILGTMEPIIVLLFEGLWCIADKTGVLEDRPVRIKGELFPYRDNLDINGYLTVLERSGFITRYKVAGSAYIKVLNFEKHQSPHHTEKSKNFPQPCDSDEDQPLTPLHNGELTVPERSDLLIPDSLIPDLRKEDSKPLRKPSASGEDSELQEACKKTWLAFSAAFFDRYGTEPVRNAKVNGCVKTFVGRIGFEESPMVAAFYVSHNDAFYVRKLHDFGLLLSDAEKVRTEWATNRTVTTTKARQLERTSGMYDAVSEIIAERAAQ